MGCIASKNSTNGNIEVEVQESEKLMGLTKRQRFYLIRS